MKHAFQHRILLLCLIAVSLVISYINVNNQDLVSLINLSVKIFVIANTYTFILINDNMILGGWKRFIEQITYSIIIGKKNTPQRHNLREWILKPIIYCEECISGQFALWFYLLFGASPYSILNHAFVIALTIVLTHKLKYLFI